MISCIIDMLLSDLYSRLNLPSLDLDYTFFRINY